MNLKQALKRQITLGQIISICVPVVVGIVLSFGNDYIMVRSLRNTKEVDLQSLEISMLVSNACLLLGLVLVTYLTNRIFRSIIRHELVTPLQKLHEGMSQMRQGNYGYRIDYEETDKLFEVYDDFNEMATEMERYAVKVNTVEEGRKRLMLGISHDLRSPLTSILAYVQGLLDGIVKDEEKQKQYLQTIKDKSMDIERMVNRLFTFAKLDSAEYAPKLVEKSTAEVLRRYVHSVRDDFAKKNMDVALEVVSDAPVMIDEELFFNVCQNLIENSVKYTNQERANMCIHMKAGNEYMKITFSDNGPGADEETLKHLWDLFYRGDAARKNPGQSNGIGLAIVKKTVEMMGGKVSAKNGKRDGLQIVIRLPLVKHEEE